MLTRTVGRPLFSYYLPAGRSSGRDFDSGELFWIVVQIVRGVFANRFRFVVLSPHFCSCPLNERATCFRVQATTAVPRTNDVNR